MGRVTKVLCACALAGVALLLAVHVVVIGPARVGARVDYAVFMNAVALIAAWLTFRYTRLDRSDGVVVVTFIAALFAAIWAQGYLRMIGG